MLNAICNYGLIFLFAALGILSVDIFLCFLPVPIRILFLIGCNIEMLLLHVRTSQEEAKLKARIKRMKELPVASDLEWYI